MILANLEYGLSHTAPSSMQAMSAAGSQQPAATSQLPPAPTEFNVDFNYDQFEIDVQDWMNEE